MARKSSKEPKKTGRPPNSQVAPGVFLRGKTYWLRYSLGGEQIRVSLETSDPQDAISRAIELRGRKIVAKKTGRVVGGKSPLDRHLEKYRAARENAGEIGFKASELTALAVKSYGRTMSVTQVEGITTAGLAQYYKKIRKGLSESTAQTYTSRVTTFAKWHGLLVSCPKFVEETPTRDVVIATEKVSELLSKAVDPDLKFILMCGFRAGMRKKEITMARPAWFDLGGGVIRIPAKDPVTGFETKSRRSRIIPLVTEFRDFIQSSYSDWEHRKWCIRPDKNEGRWVYRFDFRKLFGAFAAKHCPELTPHVMRHSYASHLANGGIGIAQLASWVGDRIATLEKHYLHLQTDAKKAEVAFSGESTEEKTEHVHSMMLEFLEAQKTDLESKIRKAKLSVYEGAFGTVEEQLAAIKSGKSTYKSSQD